VAERERYTLDTSAIIAYFTDEPGADRVAELLETAARGRIEAYASFMTYMEVLYRVWRQRGEKAGKAAYLRLKALTVNRIDVSENLLLAAARIKSTHDLSVADAWIAATAVLTRSALVHKDPEFRSLAGEMLLIELPLKPQRARSRPRRS
jgi:predicted nucleic acid-binding protein